MLEKFYPESTNCDKINNRVTCSSDHGLKVGALVSYRLGLEFGSNRIDISRKYEKENISLIVLN
jgi:lactam utilization protein B